MKKALLYSALCTALLLIIALIGMQTLGIQLDTSRILINLQTHRAVFAVPRYSLFAVLFILWPLLVKSAAKRQQWSTSLTTYYLQLRWYALSFIVLMETCVIYHLPRLVL